MWPLVIIFCSSFVIALSGAMMPGPLLTVTISESPRRGMLTGPLLIAGHGMLEMTLVAALLLGLAPLLQQKAVFIVTAVAGATVLLWMAWGMFRALPAMSLQGPGTITGRKNLLLAGILLSLANPFWTIWWVSIGLGYILHSMKFGLWGVVFFFCGHILADLFWYASVSAAVWKGKAFLNDRMYRLLIGLCASFLVVFAFVFANAGLQKLLN